MSTKINYLGLTLLIGSILIVVVIYFWYQKSQKRYEEFVDEVKKFRFGYMDTLGNTVIEPHYHQARDFHEGLAAVKKDSVWGYIDRNNQVIIPFQFVYAFDFIEGLALVCTKIENTSDEPDIALSRRIPGKWGFIDKTGKFVIDPVYQYAESFSESFALVGFNPYNRIMASEKTRRTSYDYEYNFINKNNKLLLSENLKTALPPLPFSDEMSLITNSDNSTDFAYGYINNYGKMIVSPSFPDAKPFSEGLAAVKVKAEDGTQKWAYIDKTGSIAIEPVYTSAERFSCGYALVANTERTEFMPYNNVFFIDKSGKVAFEKNYEFAQNFSENLAVINNNGEYYYLDLNGNKTIIGDSAMQFMWSFLNGYAPVTIIEKDNMIAAYMDKSKKMIRNKYLTESFNYSYNIPSDFHEGLVVIKSKIE